MQSQKKAHLAREKLNFPGTEKERFFRLPDQADFVDYFAATKEADLVPPGIDSYWTADSTSEEANSNLRLVKCLRAR